MNTAIGRGFRLAFSAKVLRFVGFDQGKIEVHGRIQHQAVVENKLQA
jgi:hypothetical protein